MNFDGEWRTAFIADEVPDLPYATAPYPVPDDQADTYGRGPVGGTIIGIPKGSPHPDEAWLLHQLHGDGHRDPGVHGEQRPERADDDRRRCSSPDLDVTPQFQTFLDMFENPGLALQGAVGDRRGGPEHPGGVRRQVAGGQGDGSGRGLASVAKQINDQLAQAAI